MVLVEGALVLVHVGIAGPGLGNQHGHHVGQRAARLKKKFHSVVQRTGVASAWRDDRIQLANLAAVQRTLQNRLARAHPTDVAADGVDFAVVRHIAVRMRQLPTGKRVGREPLMDQAERAGDERIGQLKVELFNLRSQHQTLVDGGAA